MPAPAARIVAPAVAAINTEYDPAPQYAYAYNIQDALTGDQKSQQETRDGDVVKGIFFCFFRRYIFYFLFFCLETFLFENWNLWLGSYSLVEPDGSIRTVIYTADPLNGFQAVVEKTPLVHKAVPAVAPIAPVFPPAAVPFAHAHALPAPALAHAVPAAGFPVGAHVF